LTNIEAFSLKRNTFCFWFFLKCRASSDLKAISVPSSPHVTLEIKSMGRNQCSLTWRSRTPRYTQRGQTCLELIRMSGLRWRPSPPTKG
jgi:hypothetical protein